jgi:hypothetical protein
MGLAEQPESFPGDNDAATPVSQDTTMGSAEQPESSPGNNDAATPVPQQTFKALIRRILPIDRAIAVVTFIAGLVVAWFLAWYFGSQSLVTRIPTFAVDPVRATIVDAADTANSDIAVYYKGHPVGARAVSVIRLYFWNAGNTPIVRSEILRPLVITVGNGAQILDAKILKVSRDVTGITFAAQKGTPASALLGFNIVERNDGAALQITYAGPKDAKLEFYGITVGAPTPSVTFATSAPKPESNVTKTLNAMLAGGLCLLGAGLGYLGQRNKLTFVIGRIIIGCSSVVVVVYVVLLIYAQLNPQSIIVPPTIDVRN